MELTRFAPVDRELLQLVYRVVEDIAVVWRSGSEDLETVVRRAATIWEQANRLGHATLSVHPGDDAIRKVVHDIRGGGLTMVLNAADLLNLLPNQHSELLRKFGEAARDHAKIMRNLLPDIDVRGRAEDEAAKPHGIDHFVGKWQGMVVAGGWPVDGRCPFTGSISDWIRQKRRSMGNFSVRWLQIAIIVHGSTGRRINRVEELPKPRRV